MMTTEAAALPGWFGKLPGMGDFAHRRLPASFRDAWDPWLQRGLSRLRDRHADWTAHYLQAPVWCFALGPGVVGEDGWIGVMMPSVDGVGRYFPFTVAVPSDSLAAALPWWACATRAALEGLDGDLDALRFDAVLARVFAGDAGAPGRGASLALPAAGETLWMVDPSVDEAVRMACRGLPVDEAFEALFLGGRE
jgi:type VI secretion system protein ImpM